MIDNRSDKNKDKSIEAIKREATTIDFKELDKNPNKYTSEIVKYEGEIIQIMEDNDLTRIRLALDDWYEQILYVEYDGYTDFVEDDDVTIYGEIYGSYTYDAESGWEITVPGVIAHVIE